MTARRRPTDRAALVPVAAVVAVATALALTGCAATGRAAPGVGTVPAGGLEGTVVVLAASSLTDVLTDLARRLEAEHPGLTVRTAFAGSSALAAQVAGGAPADVVVTASPATMATVTGSVGGEPVVAATNRLLLAVPAGNPGAVTSLADLADPDLVVALCAPEVPCGAVGRQALARAGVTAAPDTLEPDVRGVLARLRLDEADAGLVYRTDVLASRGTVEAVDLPADLEPATDYPALVVPGATNPAGAEAFVALLRGPVGRAALADAGFDLP